MNLSSALTAKSPGRRRTNWRLCMHFAMLFAVLVASACLMLGWNNYLQGRQLMLAAAAEEFDRMKKTSAEQIDRLHAPGEALVNWMSVSPLARATTLEARLDSLRSMAAALDMVPQITAIYMGYGNGDFFLLRPLRNAADRATFRAPPSAAYLMQSVERDKNRVRFVAYEANLRELTDVTPDDYSFDPRNRPWYAKATLSTGLVRTAPYTFFSTGNIGLTVAQRSENSVAGADITLASISQALERSRTTPSSQIVIFGSDKRAIAYSNPKQLLLADNGETRDMPPLQALSPVLAQLAESPAAYADSSTITASGREWMVRTAQLSGSGHLAVAVPLDELLLDVRAQLFRNLLITLVIVTLTVLATWLTSRRIVGNLRALFDQVSLIRQFNFSGPAATPSHITEISQLGQAMERMKSTIGRFIDVAHVLSAERDVGRLLQCVMAETHEAAGGEGSIIYLLDDDGKTLRPAAQHWQSQSQSNATLNPPVIAMHETAHPVVRAYYDTAVPVPQTLGAPRDASLIFLDEHFAQSPVMLLVLPLNNRAGAVIGMVCVFYRHDARAPGAERVALTRTFLGAASLAIDNQRLLQAQKQLLDSFIALLARAIDAKSPYTYGHCQRVPELTEMLTRAACDATQGPFADFNLTEEQWEALHVAGWLHDCGKVTTPEHVVDKATKLETIFDRVHLVRMRFEVLKRDAEIACLNKIADGADAAAARAEKDALWRTLDEEFVFVAACNEGGEFMAPEKIERLKSIAARTWQRTLDKRLGVSREEAMRMARVPQQPLPVTESLLSDKPEHIVPREARERIAEDNPWGFKLKVPEHKFNLGEIYNLSISRGTLTAEERYVINDHIAQTIMMLTELPFPAHLRGVPEIAGGHHEKMDGTGYPKKLSRNQMSVQARIMAIADIFEALTAADRPYKKGKKLSEALSIMGNMKNTGHIDAEIFDLFLQSGVYLRFAEKYVAPDCLDEVNINDYLQPTAAA